MRKFLIVAFTAFALVACNDNSIDDVTNGVLSGEVETSYIAINLSAADNTRAAGDQYQDGLDAERAVKAAYFFFFDNAGNAFPVKGSPATGEGSASDVNWISANLHDFGSATPNVSDIKDAVLVLNTYKGTYPAQIVAVINWAPTAGTAYKLEDLYTATNIKGAGDGFVMSNAVYSDGTNAVVGTPITASNIFKSPADALAKPITIYVERIAAKVTVTAKDGVAENRFKVKDAMIDGTLTEVYIQVQGWELYNDFSQSILLKDIDKTWNDATLGFTWNDTPYYRCYWAKSLDITNIGTNNFPTTFSLGLGNATKVAAGTYDANTYTYVGENTLYNAASDDTTNCTKVIIKAKLQKKTGVDTYENLTLARWYATYYAGVNELLTAVANTIKYQYYWLDGSNYKYITPGDLTVKKDGNLVIFQLSAAAELKNWYIPNGDGTYTSKTSSEMNTYLADIEKALYYDNAETLYSVDIAHLGNGTAGAHKAGDYGVVRNHIYNIVLKSFGGFGSPVYIPGTGGLVYPDDPIDNGDYVSAEVRILSWRLVTHEVDVQP